MLHRDLKPDGGDGDPALCQDHRIEVAYRDAAAGAEVDGSIEGVDEVRVYRDDDDPSEAAVRCAHAARQLQRQSARPAPNDGFADEQLVRDRAHVRQEVLAVTEIGRLSVIVEGRSFEITIRPDQRELDGEVADERRSFRPFAKIEVLRIIFDT